MDDLFQIEEALTPEEKLIRDTLKDWVISQALPRLADDYERAQFPLEIWVPELAKLGVLGLTLPSTMGGAEVGDVAYGLVCEALEWGDSGLRSFVSVQNSLCIYPLVTYGSSEQIARDLPKLISGEWIGCFGLTEPDAGSDPGAMKTTAQKVDGGWLLNGSKQWITNAPVAQVAVVWAKTLEGIRGFWVPTNTPGLTTSTLHQKMSLRASITGGLSFQNCLVPDTALLPGTHKGLGAALSCLTQARYGIAWGAMGAATFCFESALDYTKNRQVFGQPLASKQLVQADLARLYTEIVKAKVLNLQVGRLKEKGKIHPAMVSLIKGNACREALEIARTARDLLGANGISLDYHVMRHVCNLEAVYTYEGANHVHELILGKYLTGLDAF